jgi:hypothetical protein
MKARSVIASPLRPVHHPPMAIAALIAFVVVLILIGIGIAIGLVACGLLAVLIGLGVISSSVIVGFRSGRPADGIRLFLLQCGVITGVPAGAVCAWLGATLSRELAGTVDWPVIVFGGLGGALAGIVVALWLDHISRRLHRWAAARLPLPRGSQTSTLASENP